MIINYDLPGQGGEINRGHYILRIKSSGSLGNKGLVINLLLPSNKHYMEKLIDHFESTNNKNFDLKPLPIEDVRRINNDMKLLRPRKLKFEKKNYKRFQHKEPEESNGWRVEITGDEMLKLIKRNFRSYTEAKKRAQSSEFNYEHDFRFVKGLYNKGRTGAEVVYCLA